VKADGFSGGGAHARGRAPVNVDEQRASERVRYAEITARKAEYRRELRETGLAPQIATSLAAFRAAQERVALRDAIANERAALKHEQHL